MSGIASFANKINPGNYGYHGFDVNNVWDTANAVSSYNQPLNSYTPYNNSFNYNGVQSNIIPDWYKGVTHFRIAGTNDIKPIAELNSLGRNLIQNQNIEYLDSSGGLVGTGTRDSLFSQYGTPAMQGLGAAAGLWQAYNAWNQNQLLQDQLDFQKDYANRSLANQAKMVNNAYDSANNIAIGMNDTLTPAQKQARKEDVKRLYIDGSPIG